MRAKEFITSTKNVHPTGDRPDYIIGPEVERTAAYGKKTLIVNQFKDINTIQAIAEQFKCRHIYLEVTYALNHSRNQAQVLKRYRQLAQHFLKQDYTVTVDIPNELASRYADLTKDKRFVMNVAIQIPDMHKLGDRVSMKFVGGADWNKSGGVYVADFDTIRTKKNFTPWSKYNKDVKVLENMDHSKDGQAVDELKSALIAHQDRLQKASDDQVYDIIDSIMTRIARSHSISGQKLHDMWVKRYKEIPDTWIMHQQLDEGAAEHVRMVMTSAADLMKQHRYRAVGQLSEKDLEQIAQHSGATLHDVCIILNIDHVDEKLDESGLTPPNLEIKKYPGWNMYPGSFRVLAFLTPNTNPVGTLVVYPNANGQWIGEHMVVSEKYQRLGIGTAMWNFAEKTVGGPVTTVNLTADGKKFQKARAKTKQELDELSFLGSPCTKDCSGHRAGYAWSQSKGGRVAQSPFSPSFNNGSQLYVDGK